MKPKAIIYLSVSILLCFNFGFSVAQSNPIKKLAKQVYALNNAAKYDSSIQLIYRFLHQSGISDYEKCEGFMQLTFTYKRLFDYNNVLKYLDSALDYGVKTPNSRAIYNQISAEKAFALFDTQRYKAADSCMKKLAQTNYQFLEESPLSYIYMQEAYLLYLNKEYSQANDRYNLAMVLIRKVKPCHLPMIYGKKIELYGAMNLEDSMQQLYTLSLQSAQSCGISKYILYTNQMMSLAFKNKKNYEKALFYQLIYDSLNEAYNSKDHLDKITEFEKKYETEKKDYSLKMQAKSIMQLITVIIGLILIGFLYIVLNSRKKLKKEKDISILYTKQLFEKSEEERKRIAADLHDSINNELLNLKSFNGNNDDVINDKIDGIINDIRNISRNLHPVLFESLGLKMSLENLFDRLQKQHQIIIHSEINYSKNLTANAELQVYRMVQEALINTVKYAGAYAAKVTIQTQQNFIQIQIRDSGKGFQVAEKMKSGKAFGLHNIIQRSKVLGGETNIESNEKGTTITIKIPIKK